ncbi:hypothetical protein [Microbacterium sp. NPDC058389]|uniref:hypothetical protein n=1 Tax=Microbacterium sp. NPDC058389 TaxID=3346475 RepID=UPI00365F42C8
MKSLALPACVTLTLVLTSCAGSADGAVVVESPNGTVAASSSDAEGGDALFTGALTLNRAGCWAIRDESDDVVTVIWPAGTVATADGLQVPGVKALKEGAEVAGSGGEVAADEFPNVTDACGAAGHVLQFWAVREE